MADKIIAVGSLTGRDLSLLGTGFTRHFPLPHDQNDFEDLLALLDEIDIEETRVADGKRPMPDAQRSIFDPQQRTFRFSGSC